MDLDPCLDDLTEAHLEAYTGLLLRRANMKGSLSGKDASDFIQEALRKVLAGERSLHPDLDLQENLIRIGQSLVWNERKKHVETPLPAHDIPAGTSPRLDADATWNLHTVLAKVQAVLEDLDETHRGHRDARAFVECLVRQIDRRESIKPGHIGRLLGWKSERTYVAWRKVKAVVRDHLERTEP